MASINKRVPKKVCCKKARFQGDGPHKETLQQIVQAAVKKFPKAKERREVIGTTDNYYRLINNFSTVDGYFCGVMLTYERDANALALSEDDDAEVYDIEQFAPPEKDGKRREFLNGQLYFAIKGNHVAVIQSQSLRSSEFEQHLFWLFKHAKGNGLGTLFSLDDAFSKQVAERVKQKHVKTIDIGGPLATAQDGSGQLLDYVQRSNGQTFTIGGFGHEVLSAFKGALPKSLKFKDALDENIELSLRIRYVRSVSHTGQQLLDTLAMALRNHEGAETKLVLNDGSSVSGEELKLTAMLKLETSNGIILPDPAFGALVNWLHDLLASGDLAI